MVHGFVPGSVNKFSPLVALIVGVIALLLATVFHALWEYGACNSLIRPLGRVYIMPSILAHWRLP